MEQAAPGIPFASSTDDNILNSEQNKTQIYTSIMLVIILM